MPISEQKTRHHSLVLGFKGKIIDSAIILPTFVIGVLMPVVLRVNGYKFFFYEANVANEPPHVHVSKEEIMQNSGWIL